MRIYRKATQIVAETEEMQQRPREWKRSKREIKKNSLKGKSWIKSLNKYVKLGTSRRRNTHTYIYRGGGREWVERIVLRYPKWRMPNSIQTDQDQGGIFYLKWKSHTPTQHWNIQKLRQTPFAAASFIRQRFFYFCFIHCTSFGYATKNEPLNIIQRKLMIRRMRTQNKGFFFLPISLATFE